MRPSVAESFVAFSAPLEGVCTWLYCDVKGLVTTAIGVLVDPVSAALSLPWVRLDGSPASHSDIVAAWSKVKARQDLRMRGGGAYKAVTDLRLTDEGVRQVTQTVLERMDRQLAARFPEWSEWPADAQLATLSMAWACGAAFRFPRLETALRQRDFLTAAAECGISTEGNPGVAPRNRANVVLYRNASVVQGDHLDHERLWWPRDIWEHPLSPDVGPENEDDRITPVIPWPTVTRLPGAIANDDDEPPDNAA